MTGHIINNDLMSGNHNDMKDFSKLNSFTEQYNFQFLPTSAKYLPVP